MLLCLAHGLGSEPSAETANPGRKPLHRAQGTSRVEQTTASSWPLIAVIEGDGCIEARAPPLLSSACTRPSYQVPPGFPRPPRGVLAILGTAPDSVTSTLTI
jgi:hypothetical protein